jgi:CRP-like cAMP-binding protein
MPVAAPAAFLKTANLNRFLAALPAQDYQFVAPYLRTVSLGCGVILHNPHDPIEHVYFPHQGMVSIIAPMKDGSAAEIALLGRNSIVCANAILGSRVAVGRAVVQLPLTAARLSIAQLQDAANQSSAIRDLAVHYNDLLMTQVQQSAACNALHVLEARLCRWLLEARDCWDNDSLPLTQEFLGQMLAVRRTSVNASAQSLQLRNAISCSRGRIRIVDRTALEQSACECYFTIRERTDKVFRPTPAGATRPCSVVSFVAD